jgi:ribonuclease H / adenosylcobalamin/alpha-ribazole phosphatase
MLEILLTRHGLTERSAPEQYLGQRLDVPLNDAGRAEARTLHERLAGVSMDRVISSPLIRTMETAHIIRPDAEIEPDERLAEADYGDWEGHTRPEIRERWSKLRAQWEADPTSVAPPNGESAREVADRTNAFVHALVEWELTFEAQSPAPPSDLAETRRVLVVGHSTVNRILLTRCLGTPLREYRRRFRQDWTNLTVLRFVGHEGAELTLCNDLGHLRGLRGVTWG